MYFYTITLFMSHINVIINKIYSHGNFYEPLAVSNIVYCSKPRQNNL